MFILKSAFLFFIALTFVLKAAHSDIILDQQQSVVNATTGFLDGQVDHAQTFTVGSSGILSGIAVELDNPGPVTLNLLQTTHGVPTFTVLASAVATPPQPGPLNVALTLFDFTSSQIRVHVGEVLAFQPSVTISRGEVIGIDISYAGDPYTGGEDFLYAPGQGAATWQPFSEFITGAKFSDMAFETFVDVARPSAIPEPSSIFTFGSALVMTVLCISTVRPGWRPQS